MKKKIFVGNLPWKATEDMLKTLFETYGKVVSVKIVVDQYDKKKSKGFGFVEMETEEEAEAAIRELNDKAFLERNLRVSLAQERPERSAGGSGGYGSRGGDRGDRGGMGGNGRPQRSFSGPRFGEKKHY